MLEALLWLDSEAPGNENVPAILYYDSTYAFGAITGHHHPEASSALVHQARSVLNKVSQKRQVDFSCVKGHSGNTGNDYADTLAAKGSKGEQTTQSSRWLIPLGVPLPVDPLLVDNCWRCGRVYSGSSYARQLAGHEAHCKVEGTPPTHITCRWNCGRQFRWRRTNTPGKHEHHAREARNMHEKICRGSEALTRVCPFCNVQFDAPALRRTWTCPRCKANIPVAKKETHESSCRGSVKANRSCIKCKAVCQTVDARLNHERICRGSELANRTCLKCSREFPHFGARIVHEKSCGL